MAVTRNPCRYCVASIEYKGRHSPSFVVECQQCKNRKEYNEYLNSKRMFIPGEPITTLEDLLKEDWVIWHGHTKHIEMFRSWPIRTVEMFLRQGAFTKAIRKGEE